MKQFESLLLYMDLKIQQMSGFLLHLISSNLWRILSISFLLHIENNFREHLFLKFCPKDPLILFCKIYEDHSKIYLYTLHLSIFIILEIYTEIS